MTKTALLFIDEYVVKIVYGNYLKCVKFNELKLPHNQKFFNQLFENHNVIMVDNVSLLPRDKFDDWISSIEEVEATTKFAEDFAGAEKKTEKKSVEKQPERKVSKATAAILEEAAEESNRMLFRSTAESTIIVDDFQTNEEIPGMPGVKKSLAIFPWRAIDLSNFSAESLNKSKYIKRLIREGVLIPCTPQEARAMEEDYDKRLKEDNDARLDSVAPILNERVEDYVVSQTGKTGNINTMHDAEVIEISDTNERNTSSQPSLTDLMRMAGAVDDGPPIEEAPLPKRQLAQRPAIPQSGVKAKGINRKE